MPHPPFKSCPCGSGRSYGNCCGPRHDGTRPAETPEALMRARYAAYALGLSTFVLDSWHPDHRPARLDLKDGTRYLGLEIHAARGDSVEFTARLRLPGGAPYLLRERSFFERRRGRWVYRAGLSLDAGLPGETLEPGSPY